MKYIWFLLILFIVIRSIRQLRKRSISWDKPDGPFEETACEREEILFDSSPVDEPGNNELMLDTPEYLTGESSEPTTENTDIAACREHQGRPDQSEPFDGIIRPGEFVKGFVWSQILGPRGGLQAKKHYNSHFPRVKM